GRAPRAAEHLAALDGEVLAQPLDVIDEVPGGVFFQRSVRRRAPAAPLVEQYDAVSARIVIAPHHRVNAAARAAMQQHGGLADRRAAFLEIHLAQVGDLAAARPARSPPRED